MHPRNPYARLPWSWLRGSDGGCPGTLAGSSGATLAPRALNRELLQTTQPDGRRERLAREGDGGAQPRQRLVATEQLDALEQAR